MSAVGKKIQQAEEDIGRERSDTFLSPLGPGLSTGSTLLNLACSGKQDGGLLPGRYYLLVGDSASGKTFLSMTCFAEAVINPAFRDYRLIYDNVEDGMLLDLAALFNKRTARRVLPPAGTRANPCYSTTVEEFYYHIDDAVQKGKPFIYVLDSADALTSEAEDTRFEENKQAFGRGREAKGSYGDGKAKLHSQGLRRALAGLRATRSILIILSQTRDNIGFGFETKTRSGGRALRFYATVEIWTSVAKKIKKEIKGKQRQIGVELLLQVKKNRITGKLPDVPAYIYPSYGIDDTGANVDYLCSEGWWKKKNGVIQATELGLSAQREPLIKAIEAQGKIDELRKLVGQCWADIDSACALERSRRYTISSD